MRYLKIENPVKSVPSVELMRMLGASGSRGQDTKIGQFGSGFPYALALLARTFDGNGECLLTRTKICLGKDVYTFELEHHAVKDGKGCESDQWEIRMRKQGGASWDLNISAMFGAIDWQDITLAVREFISNAIDGVDDFGGNPSKDVVIDTSIPDEPRATRAKDGFIRVYIPLTDEISNYIDDLHKYFKCLAPGYSPDRQVFLNVDGGPARVYRKGVLCGTFGESSLFHYNINNIQINESRLVDSYTARHYCANAIATCDNPSFIAKYLLMKMSPPKAGLYENDLYIDYMKTDNMYCSEAKKEEIKKNFGEAIKTAVGHRVVCDSPIAAKIVTSKGKESIVVDSSLGDVLKSYGATTAKDVLNDSELQGKIITEATDAARAMLDRIWDVLRTNNLTLDRPKPGIKCFHQHSGEGMSGYYRPGDNNIYIRSDIADGITSSGMITVLHELNHHITQADDSTYDFVDFAHKVAVALMMANSAR